MIKTLSDTFFHVFPKEIMMGFLQKFIQRFSESFLRIPSKMSLKIPPRIFQRMLPWIPSVASEIHLKISSETISKNLLEAFAWTF